MQEEVLGDHAPSSLFFAKPAIQSLNVQPRVFLAKMNANNQCLSYLMSSYELLDYFP